MVNDNDHNYDDDENLLYFLLEKALVKNMMMKSRKYIFQANLVDDEIFGGDGGLWPTDLLHCNDQVLVSVNFPSNALQCISIAMIKLWSV